MRLALLVRTIRLMLMMLVLVLSFAADAVHALPVPTCRGRHMIEGSTNFDWNYETDKLTLGHGNVFSSMQTGGTTAAPQILFVGKPVYTGDEGLAATGIGSLLVSTPAQTVTVANTTTETAVLSATIPTANAFVGKIYRVTWLDMASTTGTPTLTSILKAGATSIFTTGAVTTASGASRARARTVLYITIVSLGASGSIYISAQTDNMALAPASASALSQSGGVTSGDTLTVDTRTSITINRTITWGTASASNTLTNELRFVEALN